MHKFGDILKTFWRDEEKQRKFFWHRSASLILLISILGWEVGNYSSDQIFITQMEKNAELVALYGCNVEGILYYSANIWGGQTIINEPPLPIRQDKEEAVIGQVHHYETRLDCSGGRKRNIISYAGFLPLERNWDRVLGGATEER